MSKISQAIQEQVRLRANYLCEYCHASEQWQYVAFTVDHVIPLVASGTDDLNNLALACFHCNRRKWKHLTAIDPLSGETVELFNSRQVRWWEHFVWSSDELRILGLTAVGRATIEALRFNRHPPPGDPVQLQCE